MSNETESEPMRVRDALGIPTEGAVLRREYVALKARNAELEADKLRLDWLEKAASIGVMTVGIELDGGVFGLLERPGSQPVEFREKNTVRDILDYNISLCPEP